MFDMITGLLIGFMIGWLFAEGCRLIAHFVKSRRSIDGQKPVKYRILSITYHNENKLKELGRFLWAEEFDDWHKAQAAAKKRTDEDTLKNKFDTEWTVVEAP